MRYVILVLLTNVYLFPIEMTTDKMFDIGQALMYIREYWEIILRVHINSESYWNLIFNNYFKMS